MPLDAPASLGRTSKVVMVADIVESVRLMESDEQDFITRWEHLVRHIRQEVLARHGGRMVKSLGDGVMLEFSDERSAARAAFELQRHCERSNAPLAPTRRMKLRIGLHRAEFVRGEHDIYGVGVNLAARLAAQAGPGEIVVSSAVRHELTEKIDGDLEDLGECFLKHVSEPVRIYRLNEPGVPRPEPEPSFDRDARRPVVAVIPFDTRGCIDRHLTIGELIAENVIDQLSRSPDLKVISRLSTTVFRGRGSAAADVGKHLNAHYVLSGTYAAVGTGLVISAELADSRGEVIWSRRLSGSIGDLLELESALSHELAANAHEAILTSEVQKATRQRLPTLQSHSLMMAAVSLMHRTTPDDFFRAEQLLSQLAERHQRHADVMAWMAKWHVLRVEQGWSDDPTATAQRALSHTSRALDLEPSSSFALAMDGFVRCNLLKDLDAAAQRYRAALDANPSEPLAWLFMGMLQGFTGEVQSALTAVENALTLSPFDPARYFFLSLAASVNLSAGNYGRAVDLARSSLTSNSMHVSTHRALVIALAMDGQMDAALSQARKMMAVDPGFTVSRFLARRQGAKFSEIGRSFAEALRAAGVPN